MTEPGALRAHLLAFADDEHLMGQQHTEWIGVAPFLEEDLAFSSIGQDELGHAALLYELVLAIDGVDPATDAEVDGLAFFRDASDYRSCALVEIASTDWAHALVRHWLYDAAEELRWEQLSESSHEPARALVERARREERYHRRHADALLDSLLDDPDARRRIHAALEHLLPMTPGLLAPADGEDELLGAGVLGSTSTELAERLAAAVQNRFGIDFGDGGTITPGDPAERAVRTVDFAPLMARMREVFDLDPDAVW